MAWYWTNHKPNVAETSVGIDQDSFWTEQIKNTSYTIFEADFSVAFLYFFLLVRYHVCGYDVTMADECK